MSKVHDLCTFQECVFLLLRFVKCTDLGVLGNLVHGVIPWYVLDPKNYFPVGATPHIEMVTRFDGKNMLLVS